MKIYIKILIAELELLRQLQLRNGRVDAFIAENKKFLTVYKRCALCLEMCPSLTLRCPHIFCHSCFVLLLAMSKDKVLGVMEKKKISIFICRICFVPSLLRRIDKEWELLPLISDFSIDVKYENERKSRGNYSKENLYFVERSPFSDENGREIVNKTVGKDEWKSVYIVDRHAGYRIGEILDDEIVYSDKDLSSDLNKKLVITSTCDIEGWIYNFNWISTNIGFSRWQNVDSPSCYVRRRVWKSVKIIIDEFFLAELEILTS